MPIEFEYDGPCRLMANQLFNAAVRLSFGEDLVPGARVVLAARHVSDVGDPQMDDPAAENYVSVETDADAAWEIGPANDWARHPWNRGIDLHLTSGRVPASTPVTVRIGGPGGYRMQSFAESAFRWRPAVDPDGTGRWTVAAQDACPPIKLTGNRAVGLRAIVARANAADGELRVRLKPEDAFGNVAQEGPAEADLLGDDGTPLGRVELQPGRAEEASVRVPASEQWQRLTASTKDGAIYARSNPFGPSLVPDCELLFGEIHGQSGLCDGTDSPAELYEYARLAAGLDFAAVTSHDFQLTLRDWDEVRRATEAAHRPGEFVTFLGYEWSGATRSGGDNNIYYFDDGPLVYSARWNGHPAWDAAEGQVEGSRDLRQTIAQLGARRAMVVPHCGGRRCNFDFYDPAVMPLFEIHSCHRSYEHVACEAIRRGLRFGFIGGSDDHRGALGDSHPAARERFFSSHSGLAAVYARDLTREALWEAFFARRTYATNGVRIALAVEVDGAPMGSDVEAPAGARLTLAFRAVLDGWLDRVDVLRDDAVLQTLEGEENQIDEFAGKVGIEATAEPHAYWVRVSQTDGGRAWSSPIWVGPVRPPLPRDTSR